MLTESSNLDELFDTVVRDSRKVFEDAIGPVDVTVDGPLDYLRSCLSSDYPGRALANGAQYRFTSPESRAGRYADAFLSWVDRRERPWAACLNLMDAHYPYTPDSAHDRWGDSRLRKLNADLAWGSMAEEFLGDRPWWQLRAIEALDDGGIHQADAAVGRIVEELDHGGTFDDTLVVVTSDHGEGFGERSRLEPGVRIVHHNWGIHEVLTHVPLVVNYPGETESRSEPGLATLKNFPAAVRNAVQGTWSGDEFLANDRVLASTRRVSDHDAFPDAVEDRSRYRGPWRAVYETTDDGPIKRVKGREEPRASG